MSKAIAIYNSTAEFYASLGGTLEQEVDFTIHRLEEVHGDIPVKSQTYWHEPFCISRKFS